MALRMQLAVLKLAIIFLHNCTIIGNGHYVSLLLLLTPVPKLFSTHYEYAKEHRLHHNFAIVGTDNSICGRARAHPRG